MDKTWMLRLDAIQPSQLYISAVKLAKVMAAFHPDKIESIALLPVVQIADRTIFTDGHTRAFAAFSCGHTEVRVTWDEDELDWEAYAICVQWCVHEGIYTIADLQDRVVSPENYRVLWLDRCAIMHQELAAKRKQRQRRQRDEQKRDG
jgi:hypothetical protein